MIPCQVRYCGKQTRFDLVSLLHSNFGVSSLSSGFVFTETVTYIVCVHMLHGILLTV